MNPSDLDSDAAPETLSLNDRIGQLQHSLPASVKLIAVTKTFPAAVVRAAYAAGIRDFGENKVQEAIDKQAELSDLSEITWHLIGHLQTNKVRKALQHFDWIHAIDSLKLAEKMDTIAAELSRRPHCCLQVKLVSDPTKYGFTSSELQRALPRLSALQHLNIVGLMTIPPAGLTAEVTKTIFEQAQLLAQEINQKHLPNLQIQHLSMGMSGDFELAIAAGATFIRLGTYLFGDRQPPTPYTSTPSAEKESGSFYD